MWPYTNPHARITANNAITISIEFDDPPAIHSLLENRLLPCVQDLAFEILKKHTTWKPQKKLTAGSF
jgi:hypothetical protein